jgi:hypothetical protein
MKGVIKAMNVKQLFIKEDGDFLLNSELTLNFSSEQEAAQFLVETIRFWRDKRSLFCHNIMWEYNGENEKRVNLPEEDWEFNYKTPSTCGRCVSGQEILDKIFGERKKFNALPFVTYRGDRTYSFPFDLLKHFAEHGRDCTVRLIEERKQKAARKELGVEAEEKRKLRKEQNTKLAERLSDTAVNEELWRQILPHTDNKSLVIARPDVAIVLTSRSEWGSNGGIGYYDQVRVFCGSQADMKEWQWRDRYSEKDDKPWLAVHAIGAVEVTEKDNKVNVSVELINNQHSNRTVTYTFNPPKQSAVQTLSVNEQAAFKIQVEKEVARVISELNLLWECKPKMLSDSSPDYVPYRQPSIKQIEIRPEIGVAAFVTEEQIDHRVRDPQIRHKLYVLIAGSEMAKSKAEDHGYNHEGGALLTILEIERKQIVFKTKDGKKIIKLT